MERLNVYMAPLQGLTEAVFRNAFERHFGGVAAYYTPFVRREHGEVRRKDLRELAPERNRVGHLVPQLLAGTCEEACHIVEVIRDMGYREADLNMGCAFPMVVRRGKGCGILPFPEKVRELLRVAELYPDMAFSVKMRLGYETTDECMRLLPLLNDTPLVRVAVHARTGLQQYKGECDREMFFRFAEACSHPVVYNGDVCTTDDILGLQQSGVALQGVMIGRGLLAAPWLAAEWRDGEVWTREHRMDALRAFHAALFDGYEQQLEGGEKQLLTKMKAFWEYILPDGDRKCRKRIHKAQRVADYTAAVFQLLQPD